MSIYPAPNPSTIYNPDNFDTGTTDYNDIHYLARLGNPTSEAISTSFSGSIACNGLTGTTLAMSGISTVQTVSTTDNSTNVATTAYVQSNLSNYPSLSGNNNFTGNNDFSSNCPTCEQTATTNYQLVNFQTMNNNLANYGVLGNSNTWTAINTFINNSTYSNNFLNLQGAGASQIGFNIFNSLYGYATNTYTIQTSNTIVS